jgi:hypothetical protein
MKSVVNAVCAVGLFGVGLVLTATALGISIVHGAGPSMGVFCVLFVFMAFFSKAFTAKEPGC